jgi:hypothetical protein
MIVRDIPIRGQGNRRRQSQDEPKKMMPEQGWKDECGNEQSIRDYLGDPMLEAEHNDKKER